jgi:hypothetical protein
VNVDGETNVFSRFEYHMFYVLYPFVTYLLTFPRTYEAPIRKATDLTSLTLIVLYGSSYVLSKHPPK